MILSRGKCVSGSASVAPRTKAKYAAKKSKEGGKQGRCATRGEEKTCRRGKNRDVWTEVAVQDGHKRSIETHDCSRMQTSRRRARVSSSATRKSSTRDCYLSFTILSYFLSYMRDSTTGCIHYDECRARFPQWDIFLLATPATDIAKTQERIQSNLIFQSWQNYLTWFATNLKFYLTNVWIFILKISSILYND